MIPRHTTRSMARGWAILSGFAIAIAFQAEDESVAAEVARFSRDILPILSDNCFQCHGPDEEMRKADLRLDTAEGLRSAGDHGAITVPGAPDKSLLFAKVTAADPDDRMPPVESNKSLSAVEIDLLRNWIEQGAAWQDHWAFVPPVKVSPPSVENSEWARNPIDGFVHARLEAEGLGPSPPADRRTLIRRVTYDLTGLPPAPEEIEAFVHDTSPNAYERVVDRLLGSVRYGERMALAWMDAARYGDSSVYHADGVRDMWPWRDWVIRAYNSNMPFDQFTIEQLAGDLLPNPTIDQRVATGFNRNHGTTDEGGAIDEEYRVEYVVDRVKTTSQVWLGLTMECSQCHDHKYDPISQKEYYEFYAYFNRTKDKGMQTRNGNEPPLVYLFSPEQQREVAALTGRLAPLRKERAESEPEPEMVDRWVVEQLATVDLDPPVAGGWRKLGPFAAKDADAAFADDFGVAASAPIDLETKVGESEWTAVKYEDGKSTDLQLPDNSAVYLYREITSSEPKSVKVSLGSDDAIRVWLNGEEVLSNNARRGVAADQDIIALRLKEGANAFLMKVVNAAGGSGFYFKLGVSGLPKEIIKIFGVARAEWSDKQSRQVLEHYTKNVWPPGVALDKEIADLAAQEKAIREATTTCMVMEDMEEPRKTYVLNRGHYASPIEEEVIEPGVPSCLPSVDEAAPKNRLTLARWLTDPDHPLTARVAVNRYWQMLFGEGLVSTMADFGSRGGYPTHPDLLDWLAREFIESGWDVKGLIKQIVMSAAYQQSSRITVAHLEKDPQNRLLGRSPRLRLQGEFIRDTALVLGGTFDGQVGGPSTKPYQPTGIWNEVSLDGNLRYEPDSGRKLYRRSMYIYWKRSAPMPSMQAFDAPTREKCVVQRQRTNTPLQALVTMNDVQFVEAARFFAERILKEGGGSFEERMDFAFVEAAARPADDLRREALRELYEGQLARFRTDPKRAEELLGVGEGERDESLSGPEHAAWTMVASAIMNLDEVLTKE